MLKTGIEASRASSRGGLKSYFVTLGYRHGQPECFFSQGPTVSNCQLSLKKACPRTRFGPMSAWRLHARVPVKFLATAADEMHGNFLRFVDARYGGDWLVVALAKRRSASRADLRDHDHRGSSAA